MFLESNNYFKIRLFLLESALLILTYTRILKLFRYLSTCLLAPTVYNLFLLVQPDILRTNEHLSLMFAYLDIMLSL